MQIQVQIFKILLFVNTLPSWKSRSQIFSPQPVTAIQAPIITNGGKHSYHMSKARERISHGRVQHHKIQNGRLNDVRHRSVELIAVTSLVTSFTPSAFSRRARKWGAIMSFFTLLPGPTVAQLTNGLLVNLVV